MDKEPAEISLSDKIVRPVIAEGYNYIDFVYAKDVHSAVQKILERILNKANPKKNEHGIEYSHWLTYEEVIEIIKSEMGEELTK